MSKRQLLIVGIIPTASMILFFTISLRQDAQTNSSRSEDATSVQRGQVSDKVREYSKEFKKLYPTRESRKYSEIIEENEREGKGTENISGFVGEHETFYLPGAVKESEVAYFNRLGCNAEAVVVGIPSGKSSQLTEDDKFIFTTYDFLIDEVVKNNRDSPIRTGDTIEVARSGGAVKFDGRVIRMEDYSYKPLVAGNRYLLFLRYVRGTKGYVAAGPEGDFIQEGDSFRNSSQRPVPENLEGRNEPRQLIDAVTAGVNAGCKRK